MFRSSAIATALLLVGAHGASAASTYYSITGGGAQFEIGDAWPLPLPNGTLSFLATGTMFPPQMIPVNPDPAKALIQQTNGPDPKRMTIPPGVLHRAAPGPRALGIAKQDPKLIQVRTNAEFTAPAPKLGSAVLRAGGRTGAPNTTFTVPGTTGVVFYSKTIAQFGGPLQTRIAPATPICEFRPVGNKLPCKHPVFGGIDLTCQAQRLAFSPASLLVFGAPAGFTTMTAAPPPKSPNIVHASIPFATGRIAMSASAVKTGVLSEMAISGGFPWTTGRVKVSQPDALDVYEQFTITGMDSRVNGIGTISLVSGALSYRQFSGENANRGWLRLTVPEPGASIGAAVALAVLALCRGWATRR